MIAHDRNMISCRVTVFTLLVVCIFGCSSDETQEETELYVRDISAGVFETTPVRGEVRPLRLHRDGDTYKCSMCHGGFGNNPESDPLHGEHAAIVMDHGLDQRCLHCHNPRSEDAFLDHDGSEIPDDQTPRLCGKCHGVTYKDWKIGVHGRRGRFWNSRFGERVILECIQCHDPHHPKFPALRPDPPPIRSRLVRDAEIEPTEVHP